MKQHKVKGKPVDSLVTLEYCPHDVNDVNNRELQYLSGHMGEALRSEYESKLKRGGGMVTVRFPLLFPNSDIGISGKSAVPEKLRILSEGLPLHTTDLYAAGKTPVSRYDRVLLHGDEGHHRFAELMEQPRFLYTHNREILSRTLEVLAAHYDKAWVVKKEWKASEGFLSTFLEARFYGPNTVIATYDKNATDGVVVAIKVRNISQEKKPPRQRYRWDVYIVSGQEEYISYLDGDKLDRTRVSNWWPTLHKTYFERMHTPKQIREIRLQALVKGKEKEEKGEAKETKQPEKKAKVVDIDPKGAKPAAKSVSYTYSITGSGTTTTSTNHLGFVTTPTRIG
jgi:hypothetical protein